MSDESVWSVIIAAIAGGGAITSIFMEFPIAGTILGVIAGFGLSYFVQTKTQKRAWKREFLLKNIDSIYGPLYNGSLKIEEQFNNFQNYHYYHNLDKSEWEKIRHSYTYHLIEDQKFQKELDDFYLEIELYNNICNDSRKKIDEIINRCGTKFYDVNVSGITLYLKNNSNTISSANVSDCLLINIHPKEILKEAEGTIRIQVDHRVGNTSQNLNKDSAEDVEEFEKLWEILVKEASEYKNIEKTRTSILKIHTENLRLRQKLVERISMRHKI